MTSGKVMLPNDIKEIIESFGYAYVDSYIGKWNKTRAIIQDSNGYKYDVYLRDLLRGNEIRFVDKRNPFVLENIYKWCILEKKPFILCENNIYKGALEKMTFQCLNNNCGEMFKRSWNVIYNGGGCDVCSVSDSNKNFKQKFHNLKPSLIEEWNYKLNNVLPENVNSGCGERVYWICKNCGYGSNGEWFVKIVSRSKGSGCPSCSGLVVSDRNRLSILRPKIASEWHPTLNGNLTPDDVSYGTSKKFWWICPSGHEYYSSVNDRTSERGCNVCSKEQHESKLATELKSYILNKYKSEEEYRIIRNPDSDNWLWYDIYIFGGKDPTINGVYIEIHGEQHYRFIPFWHKTKEKFEYNKKLDKLKKNFSKKNGTYIEIDLRKIKTIEQAIQCVSEKINP